MHILIRHLKGNDLKKTGLTKQNRLTAFIEVFQGGLRFFPYFYYYYHANYHNGNYPCGWIYLLFVYSSTNHTWPFLSPAKKPHKKIRVDENREEIIN